MQLRLNVVDDFALVEALAKCPSISSIKLRCRRDPKTRFVWNNPWVDISASERKCWTAGRHRSQPAAIRIEWDFQAGAMVLCSWLHYQVCRLSLLVTGPYSQGSAVGWETDRTGSLPEDSRGCCSDPKPVVSSQSALSRSVCRTVTALGWAVLLQGECALYLVWASKSCGTLVSFGCEAVTVLWQW